MRGSRYVAIGVGAALAAMIEISAYPLPYPYFYANPLRVVEAFIPGQIKWNLAGKRRKNVEFLTSQETLSDLKFTAANVSDEIDRTARTSRIGFSCVIERSDSPFSCTTGTKIYFEAIRPSTDRSGKGPYVSGPYELRIVGLERGISTILNSSSNSNIKEVLVDALSSFGVTYTSGRTWGTTKVRTNDKMQDKVFVANFSINISLDNENIEGANLFINLLRNGKVADVRVAIQPFNQ